MTSPTTYKLGFPKLKYSVVPMASGAPFQRDPTTSDLFDPKVGGYYNIGTVWPNEATGGAWMLGSITGGNTANWFALTEPSSGNVVGPASATSTALARFNGTTGKLIENSVGLLSNTGVLTGITQMGIGITPTAVLGLKAGTATAGTAPLKFALGVNLTVPEAGAVEYDGTNLYYTDSTPTRNTLAKVPSTAPSGAATRGSFTFNGSGTHAQITTTAIAATSTVLYTITTVAGASSPQAISTAIAAGVGFTPTSASGSDASVCNWVII
jgi:hypothetical protein